MARRGILWDFDGTLAWRPGGWSGAILTVICEGAPWLWRRGLSRSAISEHLQSGFPWHTPERAHPELADPEAWWAALAPVLQRALVGIGMGPAQAAATVPEVRRCYVDAAGWRVYDDVLPMLEALAARGWCQMILSNHVPELPQLVQALGLARHVQGVLTSAASGYEKPHPRAYDAALEALGLSSATVWMVGDSYSADVAGAEAQGLRGVLVRNLDARADRCCATVADVATYLRAVSR
jgi:putative hydrolase of the HAD superfamily